MAGEVGEGMAEIDGGGQTDRDAKDGQTGTRKTAGGGLVARHRRESAKCARRSGGTRPTPSHRVPELRAVDRTCDLTEPFVLSCLATGAGTSSVAKQQLLCPAGGELVSPPRVPRAAIYIDNTD